MRAVDVIRRKRDGNVLDAAGVDAFVRGATDGSWPDYQLAAMLMAIVLRGTTREETVRLTDAMTRSGDVLRFETLPGPLLDKHSTGGVGDKVSLVLAPVVAACGGFVPMMSGRGLGHTGGTLDKLEAIPGFRTELPAATISSIVRRVGCCIFSQTPNIAPADRRLYALRDVTATVESVGLITASILSKKLAEGLDALLLDVKVGRGAFMKTEAAARELAESMVSASRGNHVPALALLTAMEAPLGRAVGNALEVAESIATLKGEGPPDLTELVVAEAAALLVLGGCDADEPSARCRVDSALASGAALERFQSMVSAQGGDPTVIEHPGRLPTAPAIELIRSTRAGHVRAVHADAVANAALALGAGRDRVDAVIHPGVGVRLRAVPGDLVSAGDALAELHHDNGRGLEAAVRFTSQAFDVGDEPPPDRPLILDEVT
ncbi:MAG: thymidine phosphorylase [Vicinamibacterales bacterium]